MHENGDFFMDWEKVSQKGPKHTTLWKSMLTLTLGLGASVVAHLVNSLPNVCDSNYHIVMDNFFTSHEQFLCKS